MFNVNEMTALSTDHGAKWAQNKEVLQNKLDSQGSWYENFYFENGAATKGRSPSPKKLMALGLPSNLKGVSILDVGAYEGYYSIQMQSRGARVTANDHFIWNLPNDNSRANFELIQEITGSNIKTLEATIEALPQKHSDITLFLGVLYHLEDQIESLRIIRESAKSLVVLETLVDVLDHTYPSLKYYPGASLNKDHTNQFGPNLDALIGLFKQSGFRNWEVKSMWEFNTVSQLINGESNMSPLTSGRIVFWLYP
jgi:tRNA (mo5U34)-methyltransferase